METLEPNSSPIKRQKIETLTLNSPITPSPNKGKAPIIPTDDNGDDGDDETPPQLPPRSCGICYSDEGKSVRGLIDSCGHYFCFLCIIEWSKIESRCPLCRGRFSTIRRVRKDGSFIGEGSVKVPVRDQLYDPFGEPTDPYGNARCCVCSGTNDESLLLLCDLCDSASHTFCVGLGATVPEGDWYCQDCTLLRAEQLDAGTGDNESSPDAKQIDETERGPLGEQSPTTGSVSIFDIVRDPREPKESDSGTDRLLKLVSHPTKFSSTAIISNHQNVASAESLPDARGNSIPSSNIRESSARTLRNCRDVHKHISVVRENWDAFRTGSLSFSSNLLRSSELNVATVPQKRSCPLRKASSSTKSLQPKSKDSVCDMPDFEQSYNVQRAWKLMNAAKSLQHANKAEDASKTALMNTPGKKVYSTLSKCLLSNKKESVSPRLGIRNPANNASKRLVHGSGKHNSSSILPVASSLSSSSYEDSCVLGLSTATEVQTSVPVHVSQDKTSVSSCAKLGRGGSSDFYDVRTCSASSCMQMVGTPAYSPVLPNQGRRSSNTSDGHYVSSCSKSLAAVFGSEASSLKLEEKEISKHPRNVGVKITGTARRDDEAKVEILSLVKLNLKLLSKDKQLGSDSFKEIARVSTHTILAACGFNHREIVRSIPTLVCQHGDLVQQQCRSAIVPSSCRECFHTFVKDVVNSIFSEKINNVTVAC